MTHDAIPAITPATLDAIAYANYRTNRGLRPDIPPGEWGIVYGAREAEVMERQYQEELRQLFEEMLRDASESRQARPELVRFCAEPGCTNPVVGKRPGKCAEHSRSSPLEQSGQ